jgi:tRNA-2-methylthio-N6-dimethylallyladenosine synthase
MKKKAHLKTYGCQMNDHDSARMSSVLTRNGFEMTEDVNEADLVVLNTCSVREKPENKVYSFLGTIRELKQQNPNMIIGVGGCVAQQEGETILKRAKNVDMVFGPDQMFKLPDMISRVEQGERVLETAWEERSKKVVNFIPDDELERSRIDGPRAHIAIMKGCDNYCTFCVVPMTRGREVSRTPENILHEARHLVENGVKEIMLLGQNVNSYKADDYEFYDLLKAVADIDGLKRLRFTSPHPNDWNNALSDLMAEHPVICSQLHLPFQAGSDRILDLMRRKHTVAQYLEKIDYLKSVDPRVEISTDIIAGFPTETDEDFEGTLDVIKHVKFDKIYAFMYSTRPNTRAARMDDDVPQSVKSERLQRILALHEEMLPAQLERYVGRTESVLIEHAHPKEREVMCGRTQSFRPVNIYDPSLEIGELLDVEITGHRAYSLEGRPVPAGAVSA